MRYGADISDDGLYRYSLWREWDRSLDHMVWIMLNPSTADAITDDLTIKKCIGFAQRNGNGGITVINLYAYRTSHPLQLLETEDPEGPRNEEAWEQVLSYFHRGPVVAGWGASAPKGLARGHAVSRWLLEPSIRDERPNWLCLGRTAGGLPRHPSRLAYDTKLVPL